MRAILLLLAAPALWASAFPPGVSKSDVTRLLKSTELVRAMDDATLRAWVPERSGLRYVGCPNCNNGMQENQLVWSADKPAEVSCQYCKHRYPSEKYPMTGSQTVHTPRGDTQVYRYWADAKGYRYYFDARRDDLAREYMAARAAELAQLYAVTGDKSYARKAAVILTRFAEVFPGWCYHYDYPFDQKVIYDGDVPPSKFRTGYRTARWTWWAYSDVPTPLAQTYDWIRDSGVLDDDAVRRIERDLLRNAGDQVLANPEPYTNMSPTAWSSLVRLGRIIAEPAYVHEVARRLRTFVDKQFFYDAVWPEGAPSYHAQTVGGLNGVVDLLNGYSDPVGYTDAADGSRFDKLDLKSAFPRLSASNDALMRMRLPDGRFVPVHDTWWTDKRTALAGSSSYLLPALGHACLGGGEAKQQSQFHMTWSGGYGHQHGDNLSLLVYANGHEALSDIGYTHTRHRAWTLSTAAHNTVVIDGRNQWTGSVSAPSDGNLRWFDASSVSADGERGYPGIAKLYRRALKMVDAGEGSRYLVDVFEVEGGATHDYFLHGDADRAGTVEAALALEPLSTLVPDSVVFKPADNEQQTGLSAQQWWAYGYLSSLRAAAVPAGAPLEVVFTAADTKHVKVTLFPESASTLVLGENPAVRGAGSDDGLLDRFARPFLMLRHKPTDGRSVFVAVIEPYEVAPAIASIERVAAPTGGVSLRITANGRTEMVDYLPERESASAALSAIEDDTLVLAAASATPPAPGAIVRLVTADGWVYPFTVKDAEATSTALRIHVVEGPGMSYDGANLALSAYPQRKHKGAVAANW